MIRELAIRDLGVINGATIEFSPGFTAVTGETGAGKTMVVTALGLILGSRADPGGVRAGAGAAHAEGRFAVMGAVGVAEQLDEAGGELDGDELILARRVGSDGRSRAFAGGRSVPAGVLARIGERLVAVHGQSDQLRLSSLAAQRELLDGYIGEVLTPLLSEYLVVFEARREARGRLDGLRSTREQRVREAAELRRALEEIAAVAPGRGEDEGLDARIAVLSHAEEIRESIAEASMALAGAADGRDGADDAVGLVERARRALERAAEVDGSLGALAVSLAEARYAIEDVNGELSRYLGSFDEAGQGELASALERRALLRDLARAYGPSLDDVIAYDAAGVGRLLELESDGETTAGLEQEIARLDGRIEELADRITALRAEGASRLETAVTAELSALAMPGARILVRLGSQPDYTATGRDAVEILLAPHQGAEPRAIAKGASGGELSRVMLAIEVVAAEVSGVPTYVFDEVDAGVGGAAAIEIGRRLARLARFSQVIVVTHLAQVAAFADTQIRVRKDAAGGFTTSSVEVLREQERPAELARMLSGLDGSESGLAHARELLEMARAAGADPSPS